MSKKHEENHQHQCYEFTQEKLYKQKIVINMTLESGYNLFSKHSGANVMTKETHMSDRRTNFLEMI